MSLFKLGTKKLNNYIAVGLSPGIEQRIHCDPRYIVIVIVIVITLFTHGTISQ